MKWQNDDLDRIKNRDSAVFEKIYREYSRQIYNFILFKTGKNKHMTEEIFSSTFHSALKSAPTLKDSTKILSWLLQIASRRYCDHLRKKYRDRRFFNPADDEKIISNIPDQTGAVIEEKKDDEEKIRFIKLAIELIKAEYREVINLKYNEHKSQKEISIILDKTESAVENLLFKARKAIKKELKKMLED